MEAGTHLQEEAGRATRPGAARAVRAPSSIRALVANGLVIGAVTAHADDSD